LRQCFCSTDPPAPRPTFAWKWLKARLSTFAVNVCPAGMGLSSNRPISSLRPSPRPKGPAVHDCSRTSYFYPGLWSMRQLYQAGCFRKTCPHRKGNYEALSRLGRSPCPPIWAGEMVRLHLWYATHSNSFLHWCDRRNVQPDVSMPGQGRHLGRICSPGVNKFNNKFATEYALFRTSGWRAMSRMGCSFLTPPVTKA